MAWIEFAPPIIVAKSSRPDSELRHSTVLTND